MKRQRRNSTERHAAPFLRSVELLPEQSTGGYPFDIPVFQKGFRIDFRNTVTFFVGENGSGKSTLLEAIATRCGFGLIGGCRDHALQVEDTHTALGCALKLSWLPKVTEGFFFRAESFFDFATYLDKVSNLSSYGGKSLHAQSHGESFLALFVHRFTQGVYILDEPEAALSPARQLTFLRIIHDLSMQGNTQFLISTHSPILLAYPGATLFSLDGACMQEIRYEDTLHYQITRQFLECPARYLKHLFLNGSEDEDTCDGEETVK
ncbi:MAG TPA: AAA family ATPase [Planctomycetota bacterium]|nr:AAA family ATPase [Planctomycetota bacterium]